MLLEGNSTETLCDIRSFLGNLKVDSISVEIILSIYRKSQCVQYETLFGIIISKKAILQELNGYESIASPCSAP